MRIVKEQNVTAETAWSLAVSATRREPVNFPAFSLRTPKVFESYAAHGAPFILPPSSLILHVVFQSAAGIFFRFLFFGILGAKNRNARNAQRLARRPKSARPHASPEIDGWQPFGGARSVVTPPALLNDHIELRGLDLAILAAATPHFSRRFLSAKGPLREISRRPVDKTSYNRRPESGR